MLLGNPLSRLSLADLALPEGLEPEDEYHSGLTAHDWVGMLVHTGDRDYLSKLKLYMTTPEDREAQATGIAGIAQAFLNNTDLGDLVFNTRDPESEQTNMGSWLCKLGIPLEPGSPAESVHQYLDQQATSLAWCKPWEVPSKFGNTVSYQRAIAILPDGLVVEAVLRAQQLYEWQMIDIEKCVLADPMEHSPRACRRVEKEQLIANVDAGHLPTMIRYTITPRDQDFVWQRNFELPPEESQSEEAEEEPFSDDEEVAQALGDRVPLSRVPPKQKSWISKLRTRNSDTDEEEDAESHGQIMFRQQWMKKKYGSFPSMLEQAPQDALLHSTAFWFLYPDKKNAVAGRELGRMAFLLYWLYSEIRHGSGLSGWLEYHWLPDENDAEEAAEALRTIGANELLETLYQLSQKAKSAGCNPRKASGWERFFEQHECEDEEEQAYAFASSLPDLFHRCALKHPDLIAQGEASVAEITKERPLELVDAQEHLAAMMGGLGRLMKPLQKGLDKSLKDLSAVDGMEDSCAQFKESLDEMELLESMDQSSDSSCEERNEILKEFQDLSGVIARAPEEELFAIIADVGGYDADEPSPQMPPAVRMAGMLDIWLDEIEEGLDDWFDISEHTEIEDVLMVLRILQSPLAERVHSAYEAGRRAGAGQDEEFEWYEFADTQPDSFPNTDTLQRESMRLPSLYREYWKQRPVGNFEEPALAS